MNIYNATIEMDIKDYLHKIIECQVEMLLRKLLIGANSGDSFALEASEKKLHKNVIGLSSDKLIKKGKKHYLKRLK